MCKCHQPYRQFDPLTRKLKGRCQKIVGLFPQNMKLDIFCNGHKKILNDVMGYNPLPTMGVAKEVDPHGV
jgi:hypothetical protein